MEIQEILVWFTVELLSQTLSLVLLEKTALPLSKICFFQ